MLSFKEGPFMRRPSLPSSDATFILNGLENLIPNLNTNIKKMLNLDLPVHSQQRRHSMNDIPMIEVKPPSPGTPPARRPSHIADNLNKVLNETLEICRIKIRRCSAPSMQSFLDVKKPTDQPRRVSMPCISAEHLLQVPKPSKNKRRQRRHSLPSVALSTQSDDALKPPGRRNKRHSVTNFPSGQDLYSAYRSQTNIPFKVHEIYISGNHDGLIHLEKNINNDVINDDDIIVNMAASIESKQSGSREIKKDLTAHTSYDVNYHVPVTQDGERQLKTDSADFSNGFLLHSSEHQLNNNKGWDNSSINETQSYKTFNTINSQDALVNQLNLQDNGDANIKEDFKKLRTGFIEQTFRREVTPCRHTSSCESLNNNTIRLQDLNNRDKNNNSSCLDYTDLKNKGGCIETNGFCGVAKNTSHGSQQLIERGEDFETREVLNEHRELHAQKERNVEQKLEEKKNIKSFSSKMKFDVKTETLIDFNATEEVIDIKKFQDREKLLLNLSVNDDLFNTTTTADVDVTLTDDVVNNRENEISSENTENWLIDANSETDSKVTKYNERSSNKNKIESLSATSSPTKSHLPEPLEKASSMSHLDNFVRTSKHLFQRGQRAISLHEDSIKHSDMFNSLGSSRQLGSHGNLEEKTSASLDELETNQKIRPVRMNKEFANAMFRKAVSLCELQNMKLKENMAKIEKRFISTEGISKDVEEDTDEWFPRLSYKDCSSCTSCRSRSSSYHSLLYDENTATNYQIYQPTVCDVDDNPNTTSKNNDETVSPTDKMAALKSKKDRLVKQSHTALGSFKDKLRRTKSKT